MSIGRIEEVLYYFDKSYKGHFEKFYLFNLSNELYRGYITEVYTVYNGEHSPFISPVIHVFRIPPTNTRWFSV